MSYTVKQLADLAGVSPRTLHYYDQIGLLHPEKVARNGYRYYSDPAMLRLQQILFFKELGFSLEEIREIVDRPGFNQLEALRQHKIGLQERLERMKRLIATIDKTILNLEGAYPMKKKQYFEAFSEEKQKQYEAEIRQRYGEKAFAGVTDWNSYTPEQKAAIQAESEAIYRELGSILDAMGEGAMRFQRVSPLDGAHLDGAHLDGKYREAIQEAQPIITRWHQHLRYFYEPTIERLRGLGQLYVDHPDFRATFTRIHPALPEFMKLAIEVYCDKL
jgi:DNA-binding transcriptional MerR regulator